MSATCVSVGVGFLGLCSLSSSSSMDSDHLVKRNLYLLHACRRSTLLNPLFVNITNNASQDCSDANISVSTHTARGNFSCFVADGDAATAANADDAGDCTAYAALTMFSRL